MLFVDDATLTAHTKGALQRLISCFPSASREFGLTISLKKTSIMGQDVNSTPSISIGDYLSLNTELNTRIGKAATTMARLAKRVWDNSMLTIKAKLKVYQACVLSTLLYSCETWTLCSRQECRHNIFHLRCLRRILGITRQDRVPNKELLAQAGTPSMCLAHPEALALATPCQPLACMQNGRIPKDMLYDELATGSRPADRPFLRFKNVSKRNMKKGDINPTGWEAAAADRSSWRLVVKAGIQTSELRRQDQWEERRERRR